MRILAIDMGWSNSVSCVLDMDSGEVTYEALCSGRHSFARLITRTGAGLVVIEAGPMAGWVRDLCDSMNQKLLVLNTNDEPWQWRNVKKKTDRKDALKLARIAAVGGESVPVHVPAHRVRQWRQLIYYRETLVSQRVSIKNRLRAILLQEDLRLPAGKRAWEGDELARLKAMGRPLKGCEPEELWKGLVQTELNRLQEVEKHLVQVERKLDEIGAGEQRVRRLMQVPGVGTRTAELVVAMLDDPRRFGRGREVGCYAGLTPRKRQSGKMDHDGHISRGGNGLLRKYLVQAAWSGKRSEPRLQEVYERARRKSPRRRKQAIVAAARHLLVWLWAMLRDGSDWKGGVPGPQGSRRQELPDEESAALLTG